MDTKKNKKRIYFTILAIVLLSLLVILLLVDWEGNQINNLVESDLVFEEATEIVVSTEYPTYDKDIGQITYYIENMTDKEFTFGMEYSLEVKVNDTWYQIPYKEGAAWNAIGYILSPRATTSETIHLSIFDYRFNEGEYRFVKPIANKYYYTTFTLGNSGISKDTPYGFIDLSDLPKNYSIEDAKKDGVVIFSLDGDYNLDKIENFLNKIKLKTNTMLRIMEFTEEGDPLLKDIIYENIYDGRYLLREDSTRDNFASPNNEVKDSYYSYVITDNANIYLSNCVSFDVYKENKYLDTPFMILSKTKLTDGDAINTISEIERNHMEHNITRYKKFNIEGDCYALVSEKNAKDEYSEFGYASLGRGAIERLLDPQGIVTDIYGIEWINNKQFVLLCKTTQAAEYYALFDISNKKITSETYGNGFSINDGQISS